MKKQEGGYILAYVLVVVVILCILATGICSVALRNMQTQQASVERTKQLYTAEGRIEQFTAAVQAKAAELPECEAGSKSEAKAQMRQAFLDALDDAAPGDGFSILEKPGDSEDPGWSEEDADTWQCTVSVASTEGEAAVAAELCVVLGVSCTTHSESDEDGNVIATTFSYSITGCGISYNSYTITSAESEEGGET